MTYQPLPDDQPDHSPQGVVITASGNVRMVGDPRRYSVFVGDRLQVASRLTMTEAMQRAFKVIRRGRYPSLEVSIRPAIDIPADYLYHGMEREYQACLKRHQQRRRKARRSPR